MAWERRSQRGRHRGGRRLRGGLVLALLGLTACAGERNLFGPDRTPGAGGAPVTDARLYGEWETIILVEIPEDRQTWTTNWLFRSDATCRFIRTVRSIVDGVPRVTLRACTWRTANAEVRVTWTEPAVGSASLPYDFAAFDPNRLVLEGIEYRRVANP